MKATWATRSRSFQVTRRAASGFLSDGCPQAAAAISYYTLFGLFPLSLLAVALVGVLEADAGARDRITTYLLDNLPLRAESRQEIADVLYDVTANAEAFGVIGLVGLVFAASGLMGTLRSAVNTAWGVEDRRSPLRGKAFDILLVLVLVVAAAGSLGLTLVVRAVVPVPPLIGQLLPIAVTLVLLTFLYRILPAIDVRTRDVLPGALVAAVGYELTKTGFAIYIDNFGRYSAIYGSLGAVVAFLFFVWLAANVFLFGAEVSAEVARDRKAPDRDGEQAPVVGSPG